MDTNVPDIAYTAKACLMCCQRSSYRLGAATTAIHVPILEQHIVQHYYNIIHTAIGCYKKTPVFHKIYPFILKPHDMLAM